MLSGNPPWNPFGDEVYVNCELCIVSVESKKLQCGQWGVWHASSITLIGVRPLPAYVGQYLHDIAWLGACARPHNNSTEHAMLCSVIIHNL